MRTLFALALVMSFSFVSIAEARVKENIKQKNVATSVDGSIKAVKQQPQQSKGKK